MNINQAIEICYPVREATRLSKIEHLATNEACKANRKVRILYEQANKTSDSDKQKELRAEARKLVKKFCL